MTAMKNVLITKGAFAQIESICSFIRIGTDKTEPIESHKAELEKKFTDFGSNGLRAIGICYKNITQDTITKDDEKDMVFAGFILLEDPVKAGIADTIAALNQLHVGLKNNHRRQQECGFIDSA